jgi:alkanesulfonate monooxygenase SsuD/methylene tetrahydromethanopterin reductase-like flavin-dependent oxidoreductase (luciferase family)
VNTAAHHQPDMKSTTARKRKASGKAPDGADAIATYADAQTAEHAAICRALHKEIDAALSEAAARIYHAIPVWFIGGNAVVGYNVAARKGVNLLFWNGQSFDEPMLKAAGKFRAAQIQFTAASQIDFKALRR